MQNEHDEVKSKLDSFKKDTLGELSKMNNSFLTI